MKMIIVALALVAVTVAAPPTEPLKILRSEFEKQPQGTYVFSFETENGILRVENGDVKTVVDAENKPHDVIVVHGSSSYINVDGKPETVNYHADETGYHAVGTSIPKSSYSASTK